MPEFKYEINEKIATLSEKGSYATQANIITYGDNGKPKLDLRKWNTAEERMGKGITLNREEAQELLNVLKDFDFNKIA